MRKGVIETGKKYVEEVQQYVKYYYISSFIFKPPYLLTQGFKENNNAQDNILKHMCNFGEQEVWRDGIRYVSSYPDVDTSKYQYCLINPIPLDFIIGYIMEDSVGDRYLKRPTQRSLNLIDGYISSY